MQTMQEEVFKPSDKGLSGPLMDRIENNIHQDEGRRKDIGDYVSEVKYTVGKELESQ